MNEYLTSVSPLILHVRCRVSLGDVCMMDFVGGPR